MAQKLSQKEKQLAQVNSTLKEYKLRFEALEAQLRAPQKRNRSGTGSPDYSKSTDSSSPSVEEAPPPRKKPSPELPRSVLKGPRTARPTLPIREPSRDPEETPPSPDRITPPKSLKPRPYLGLHSTICAYRDNGFTPGQDGISYAMCAELLKDEINAVLAWDATQKEKFHPMIIDALKVIYPSKPARWDNEVFSNSSAGSAKYWIKVLKTWRQLWLKKDRKVRFARRVVDTPDPVGSKIKSVADRIRAKLASKTRDKVNALQIREDEKLPVKPAPIIISDSDSDGEVVAKPSASLPEASSKSAAKLAHPPESYTRAEMKMFAKMARSIRNTSDGAHVPATANFLDAEFSDNTGRAARILKSPFTWKRNRFKEIAAKGAKILEDRCALTSISNARNLPISYTLPTTPLL